MALGKHRKTEMKGDTSRGGKREEAKRVSKKVRRSNDKEEVAKAPPIEEVMAEKRLADSEVVVWFWRGGGVAKAGPYPTQLAAWQSTISTDGLPIEGATVWCEVAYA